MLKTMIKCFNFDEVLNNSEKDVGKNWKSITEKDPEANKTFPIIDSANIEKLRSAIKEDLSLYMKDNYPFIKKGFINIYLFFVFFLDFFKLNR